MDMLAAILPGIAGFITVIALILFVIQKSGASVEDSRFFDWFDSWF
jgi:hypothetical protein